MRRDASVVRWSIERLVPGGDGLTRLSDGRVGFASGALPGDRIEVVASEDKRGYRRATHWRLIQPGPVRIAPSCPVAEQCGGCDWMALERGAQIEHKAAIVKDALTRVGRVDVPGEIEVVTAERDLGYRNRLRLHIDRGGRVGLLARGSHRLVEIPACQVAAPEIDGALARIRVLVAAHPGGLAAFETVEIRVSPSAPLVTLCFKRRERTEPANKPSEATNALMSELSREFAVDTGDGPAPVQRYTLPGGIELDAPTGVFTQVNWAVNERLVEAVVQGALERHVSRFCDLYAGAGNFALALLGRELDGVAVEESRAAISAAEHAARRQGLTRGRFVSGNVVNEIRRLLRQRDRFDLVIADPPRIGARDALPLIERLGAPFVALCSCDPPTLARDAARLVTSGYRVERVTAFDMFPQTHHVEVLVWLGRG